MAVDGTSTPDVRLRTVQIRAGRQFLTAEDPLLPDLRDALALIK